MMPYNPSDTEAQVDKTQTWDLSDDVTCSETNSVRWGLEVLLLVLNTFNSRVDSFIY